MKHAKRFLAALLAGVLALAAFTGCSGLLNFATVQVNTEEAQALMKQVSPALQYDTQLEYAAERIAQWMTEEVTNLTTADGQLVRKVQLDPGTGNMNPGHQRQRIHLRLHQWVALSLVEREDRPDHGQQRQPVL